MTINNINQLGNYFGVSADRIEKRIQDKFNEDMSFEWNTASVRIEGIISRDESVSMSYTFRYPFDIDTFLAMCKKLSEKIYEVYDDPFEMIMNYTDPFEIKTLADAERLVSQAIADGWSLPPWFTPQCCYDSIRDIDESGKE